MAAVEEPIYDITISYVSFAAVPMSLAMSQEVDKTPATCIPCQPLQAKRHFCHKLKPESSLPTKGQDSPRLTHASHSGAKNRNHILYVWNSVMHLEPRRNAPILSDVEKLIIFGAKFRSPRKTIVVPMGPKSY